MVGFVIVVAVLAIIVLGDGYKAYETYRKDRKMPQLILHAGLLIVLTIVVVNTTCAILGAEFEIPFMDIRLARNSHAAAVIHKAKTHLYHQIHITH